MAHISEVFTICGTCLRAIKTRTRAGMAEMSGRVKSWRLETWREPIRELFVARQLEKNVDQFTTIQFASIERVVSKEHELLTSHS